VCIWAGVIKYYNKLEVGPDVRNNIGLTVFCLSGESSSVFEFTFADQEFVFLFTIAIMAPNRDATNLTTTLEYRAIVASWSPEERAAKEKTLKRKIDLRLLPILVSNTLLSEQ
jgi:hypothetical protein